MWISEAREGGLFPDAAGYCYLAAWHFDLRMEEVTKRLLTRDGNTLERRAWLIVAGIYLGAVVLVFFIFPGFPATLIAGAAVILVLIWLTGRARRFKRQIVNERLCLRCGYPLLKSPVDESGWGCCSECGRRFNTGEYRRPPKGYQRIHSALLGETRQHAGDSQPTYLP